MNDLQNRSTVFTLYKQNKCKLTNEGCPKYHWTYLTILTSIALLNHKMQAFHPKSALPELHE